MPDQNASGIKSTFRMGLNLRFFQNQTYIIIAIHNVPNKNHFGYFEDGTPD